MSKCPYHSPDAKFCCMCRADDDSKLLEMLKETMPKAMGMTREEWEKFNKEYLAEQKRLEDQEDE